MMNPLNATENRNLIRAITCAREAAGLLPDGHEWCTWLRDAYYAADRAACLDLLGFMLEELAEIEGAYDRWSALGRATAAARLEGC